MNRIKPIKPADELLRVVIEDAKSTDDVDSLRYAIELLRRRQLARGDVQAKVARIFEGRKARCHSGGGVPIFSRPR